MNYKTLRDADLKNKTVLVRMDLNVPVQDGKVSDTTRIDRLKPTIDYLIESGIKQAKIISHFGRPKGQKNPDFSLSFLPPVLSEQWGVDVGFGEETDTQITLLENIRFHDGEEKNDPNFAKQRAKKADLYINDAFSVSHRAHASTEGITHFLPSYAGLAMEAELKTLENALESPISPVMAIVGGSKISTKLSVLNNLIYKVDYLVLGGAMANTFLLAKGQNVGASMCEKDMIAEAQNIMAEADKIGCQIVTPLDCVVTGKLEENAAHEITILPDFPDNKSAVDVGEKSIANVCSLLDNCNTLLWNGPMGVFEIKPFDNGTNKIAQYAAQLTKEGKLLSVAGGGDTVSAIDNADVIDDFSYVSTAGGAFLEWLEGKTLPGIAALENAAQKAA
jgi:phosphoglycerate kinase